MLRKVFSNLKTIIKVILSLILIFGFKYLLNHKKKYVFLTNQSYEDGAGAQLQRKLSILAFSDFVGVQYVNSPLDNFDYSDGDKADWVDKIDKLICFPSFIDPNLNLKRIRIESLFKVFVYIIFYKRMFIYEVNNCYFFSDLFPNSYKKVINFYKLEINNILNTKKEYKALIHYRYPRLLDSLNIYLEKERDIGFDKLQKILEELIYKENLNYNEICIISTISDEEFLKFKYIFQNIQLDNKSGFFEAIYLMSTAEILVVGQSSMSYVAGLFNQNKVYISKGFWHSKLTDWENME